MSVRDDLDRLDLTTSLLQRTRTAHPTAGVWEAADVQWWWRSPRVSDDLELPVWRDEHGPVAAVVLTEWSDTWQCDPLVVPRCSGVHLSQVWARALEAIQDLDLRSVDVLVREDDCDLIALLDDAGFVATGERSGITWMPSTERPPISTVAEGFCLVDRAGQDLALHPMRRRNGDSFEIRIRQCSLYDPELDLAVQAPNGDVAAYALFWLDPTTGVGMVEPMRTEDEYQRRGLARGLLAAGLHRLAQRGATRLKVGFDTDAARDLYLDAGFTMTSTVSTYRRRRTPRATQDSVS